LAGLPTTCRDVRVATSRVPHPFRAALGVALTLLGVLNVVLAPMLDRGSSDYLEVAALIAVCVMAARAYYADLVLPPAIPASSGNTARLLFWCVLSAIVLASAGAWFFSEELSSAQATSPAGVAARLLVAALLLWHGFALVFGSLFLGVKAWEIVRNPAVLIFWPWRGRKRGR